MAEIVNLRGFRKNKRRQAQAAQAARNNAASGRSKLEKARDRAVQDRQQADLDGKKLEGPQDTR